MQYANNMDNCVVDKQKHIIKMTVIKASKIR